MSAEEVVKAAARVLMDAALDLLQADPQSWSERPCPTCRPISAIIGRPFGCYVYAQQEALRRRGQVKP
jgi:hypothetical protein